MNLIDKKYEAFKRLGLEFKIPIPEYFVELEVFDREGNLIQRHKQRALSLVRNFYNSLICYAASINAPDSSFGAGYLNIKDTGGTVCYSSNYYPQMLYGNDAEEYGYVGDSGDTTFGIVVGSGTIAESFEQYKLQTKINEGSGSGQLNYAAGVVPSKSWSSPVMTITHIRYMNNNSGGTVSVNEVGIYTGGQWMANLTKFMVHRDKLPSQIDVPDTGQLKVTYTIQITYPS